MQEVERGPDSEGWVGSSAVKPVPMAPSGRAVRSSVPGQPDLSPPALSRLLSGGRPCPGGRLTADKGNSTVFAGSQLKCQLPAPCVGGQGRGDQHVCNGITRSQPLGGELGEWGARLSCSRRCGTWPWERWGEQQFLGVSSGDVVGPACLPLQSCSTARMAGQNHEPQGL